MTSPRGPAADELPFAAEVAAYLRDCETCRVRLDRAYHPTEDGAVKLVFHRRHHDPAADQVAEEQIRDAFRALTSPTGSAPKRRGVTSENAESRPGSTFRFL